MPRSELRDAQVAHNLNDHEDIDGGPGQTPEHGDSFVYDAVNGWQFVPVAGGHSRGHLLWDVLDHTDIQGSPTDGQAIVWNATAEKWEPGDQAGTSLEGVVYVDTPEGNAEMVYCETTPGEIEFVEVDP